jgi:hypothetical protein
MERQWIFKSLFGVPGLDESSEGDSGRSSLEWWEAPLTITSKGRGELFVEPPQSHFLLWCPPCQSVPASPGLPPLSKWGVASGCPHKCLPLWRDFRVPGSSQPIFPHSPICSPALSKPQALSLWGTSNCSTEVGAPCKLNSVTAMSPAHRAVPERMAFLNIKTRVSKVWGFKWISTGRLNE